MKNFFNYLLNSNADYILKKSIRDCHVKGLHSVVLCEVHGRLNRVYLATRGHELWSNTPNHFYTGAPMSLSFHPHHCDLRLTCLHNQFYNWIIKPAQTGGPLIHLDKFRYYSKITENKLGFKLLEKGVRFFSHQPMRVSVGGSILLDAHEIHTVSISEEQRAAWLVEEGDEDKNYQPFCYANSNLEKLDTSHLYKPFASMEEIKRLFADFQLI